MPITPFGPAKDFKPENFKRITRTPHDSLIRRLTGTQDDGLREIWVIVTELDGSETTYHLPKKLSDML